MVISADISAIEQVKDHETEAYEGSNPVYFRSDESFGESDPASAIDSSSVSSGIGGASSSSSASGESSSVSSESSNYITSGDSSSSAEDIMGSLEDRADSILNGIGDDSDLYYEADIDGTKYWLPDEEKLEQMYRTMRALVNLNLLLAMIFDLKFETLKMIDQSFADAPPPPDSSKADIAGIAAKRGEKVMSDLQRGVASLIDTIKKHNDAVYADETKSANGYSSSWGDFVSFITSGSENPDELERLQRALDANNKYKAALRQMEESLTRVLGGGFQGLVNPLDGSNVTDRTQETAETLTAVDEYIKLDKNGYIDLNSTKEWITELRRGLSGFQNMSRLVVSSASSKEETQKMIFEAFTEIEPGSSKTRGAQSATETEAAYEMSLFDRLSSTTLQIQKYTNEARFLVKQIDKYWDGLALRLLAGVLKIVGLIASLVVTIVTFGAGSAVAVLIFVGVNAGAQALAALADWGAAKIADSVSDEYTPSAPDGGAAGVLTDRAREGREKKDEIEQAGEYEARIEELQSEVGFGQINTTGDGFYQIDSAAISSLSQKISGLQNALRLISKIRETRAANHRLIFRAMTGMRAGSVSPLIEGALETSLMQKSVEFSALTSYLQEIKEAHNNERQQEIAMEKATFGLAMGMIFAVAGAILGGVAGGAAGALMGWGIGQTIGKAVAGVVSANLGAWGDSSLTSQNVSFNPNLRAFLREQANLSSEVIDKIDYYFNQVYTNLLADKSIVSAGNGYFGVDPDRVTALQKQLMRIQNVLLVLTSMQELRAKISANIRQSMGFAAEATEGSTALAKAFIQNNFETFNYLRQLVAEKVEVKNRAVSADKEATAAWVKFGVSVGVSAAGIGLGAGVTSALFAMISPTIAVINAIVDIVQNALDMRADYGSFNRYADQNAKPESATSRPQAGDKAERAMGRLDERADGIELDGSFIADADNGNWGLDMGMVARTRLSLENISRARDILVDIKKTTSELCSRISGQPSAASVPMNMTQASFQNIQNASLSKLEGQVNALRTIVSRNNQMNSAERGVWQASIRAVVSAASFAFTAVNAATGEEIKDYQEMVENGTETSPEEDLNYEKNNETIATFTGISIASDVAGAVSDYLTGLIYDKAASTDKHDSGKAAERKQVAEEKVKNYENSVDAMEEKAVAFESQSSNIEIDSSGIQAGLQRNADLLSMLSNLFSMAPGSITNYVKAQKALQDDAQGVYPRLSRERRELLERMRELELDPASMAAASSQEAQQLIQTIQAYNAAKAEFEANPANTELRSRMLAAYADMVEARIAQVQVLLDKAAEVRRLREQALQDPEQHTETQSQEKMAVMEAKCQELRAALEAGDYAKAAALMAEIDTLAPQVDAEAMDAAAEAHLSRTETEAVEAGVNREIDEILKSDFQGKTIDQLSPEELQSLYEKLYVEMFKPGSEKLQELRARRIEINSKLKDASITPERKAELTAELAGVEREIGQVRNKINGFNRLVGKIRQALRALPGHSSDELAVPSSVAAAPIVAGEPEAAPAVAIANDPPAAVAAAVRGANSQDAETHQEMAELFKNDPARFVAVISALGTDIQSVRNIINGISPLLDDAARAAFAQQVAEGQIDRVKAEKVAGLLGIIVAPPPAAAPVSSPAPAQQASNAKPVLDYVDNLLRKISETNSAIRDNQARIETAQREIQQTQTRIERLEGELRTAVTPEAREAIKVQISELKAELEARKTELNNLIAKNQQLARDLPRLKAESQQQIRSANAEIEVVTDAGEKRMLEHARAVLRQKLNEIATQGTRMQQEIRSLMGQVRSLQGQINRLERDLRTIEARSRSSDGGQRASVDTEAVVQVAQSGNGRNSGERQGDTEQRRGMMFGDMDSPAASTDSEPALASSGYFVSEG